MSNHLLNAVLASSNFCFSFPDAKTIEGSKNAENERVREPATRFGEDPFPWRSFILLRRLLQHTSDKQLPTWAEFKAHL